MRIVVALALLAVAVPVAGRTAEPRAPAKPAAAAPDPGLPAPERAAIQNDLIWTGDYNGVANGDWGERTVNAIKAFQKRKGGRDTGTLTPEERAALAADARAKRDALGWRIVGDDSGARVGIPGRLVPQSRRGANGGHWQSAHGEVQIDVFRDAAPVALVYERERKVPGRRIEYAASKPDFFVLSGLQGLKKFYIRAQAGEGEVRGIRVLYDQAMETTMEPAVIAISGAFEAFPAAALARDGTRRVEYATGVVVSAAGDIVTDRQAIDGCEVIVAGALGNAERVADDRTGIALIRVYGARDLKPLALGEASHGGVTLVGIADPKAQNGNAAVSTAKAKVTAAGDAGVLDGALAPGFAGAAAIDADAGFAGVAVGRPQVVAGPATPGGGAALAPPEAIRRLLAARSVAPLVGKAGVEFAKDSVVRVICVRK